MPYLGKGVFVLRCILPCLCRVLALGLGAMGDKNATQLSRSNIEQDIAMAWCHWHAWHADLDCGPTQVVSEDVGLALDKIDLSKLGTAKKVGNKSAACTPLSPVNG